MTACTRRSRSPALRADGRTINLGGKVTVAVNTDDRFLLLTPGGGGYGAEEACAAGKATEGRPHDDAPPSTYQFVAGGSLLQYRMAQDSA